MKKLIVGFLLGLAVSLSTVVYASDSVQSVLYQAKLLINGQEANPEASGYVMLNYDGHAYVPLRYVAEKMNTAVSFDEASQTITLDDRFDIEAVGPSYVKAGNLKVSPENGHSKIDVQLYFTGFQTTTRVLGIPPQGANVELSGKLAFWNGQGLVMEQVPFSATLAPGSQMTALQLESRTDLTGYAAVTITDPIPRYVELPYSPDLIMNTKDETNRIQFGMKGAGKKVGDYTLFRVYVSATSSNVFGPLGAKLTFYGNNQEVLGTANLQARLNGLDGQLVEVLGRGDLTAYKSVAAEVVRLDAEPSYTRKLPLSSELLKTAATGSLTPMEFGLGVSRAEVALAWGAPQSTGTRQTPYEGWGDYQIYFSGPNETVGAIGIDGSSIGYKVDEVKLALGQPAYEGTSLVTNGWELSYQAGDYWLYFEADQQGGTVRHLTYKKQ